MVSFIGSTYVRKGLFRFHSKETGTLSSYISLAYGAFRSVRKMDGTYENISHCINAACRDKDLR